MRLRDSFLKSISLVDEWKRQEGNGRSDAVRLLARNSSKGVKPHCEEGMGKP
jgi:hypothetical protein